jgi:hypothetical protein
MGVQDGISTAGDERFEGWGFRMGDEVFVPGMAKHRMAKHLDAVSGSPGSWLRNP